MNLRQMKVLNKSKLVKLNKNTQHLQILNKAQAMQILYKKMIMLKWNDSSYNVTLKCRKTTNVNAIKSLTNGIKYKQKFT